MPRFALAPARAGANPADAGVPEASPFALARESGSESQLGAPVTLGAPWSLPPVFSLMPRLALAPREQVRIPPLPTLPNPACFAPLRRFASRLTDDCDPCPALAAFSIRESCGAAIVMMKPVDDRSRDDMEHRLL